MGFGTSAGTAMHGVLVVADPCQTDAYGFAGHREVACLDRGRRGGHSQLVENGRQHLNLHGLDFLQLFTGHTLRLYGRDDGKLYTFIFLQ